MSRTYRVPTTTSLAVSTTISKSPPRACPSSSTLVPLESSYSLASGEPDPLCIPCT
ncbi:hypothetical protein CC86DRAFT_357320 [Ophiobolus disseminans]|uniref:Uncharacterized protein n=1 Tax=Ophiobolus disseminans TaxID=1469910 RepID=A0A6A6ZQ75_9PLEO|nr:hypothetical protein CC86DRAFT_357320 [Ophiobolus disseminans]